MKYRVTHVSRYEYGSSVDLAAHMLHLRPRTLPWQRIVSERLVAEPDGARRRDAEDHFGNVVTWLFLDRPHADFSVTAESVVEVSYPPPPDKTAPWEAIVEAARGVEAGRAAEYRFDSPMAPAVVEAADFARTSFTPGRPVLDALIDLNRRIYREFRFHSGATTISTPVVQVMKRREGVCQDFSHVMVSALRGLGVPARYNSGYIRTRPPPGQPRRQGADQSHAWVGAWLGPEHEWVDLDPTNGIVVHDEHVLLGWGRDYGDVSPVQGVILGGGAHHLKVNVDLEPDEAG
ncbi:MAG: transglutaminase family protein [Acetobacteraceae bacterium]|nr:transglutaminase family protein [Acetobacteraceae bacterium]